MFLRIDGWRVIASVAVCIAAAGAPMAAALLSAVPAAMARDLRPPPVPGADIPFPQDMMTTGGTQPTLVWGGPLPPEPIPGEVPVYVPSQSVVPSMPQPLAPPAGFVQPAWEPEAEIVDEPEPAYAPAEEIYRQLEPEIEPRYALPPPEPRGQAKRRLADEDEPGFEPAYRAPEPSMDAPSEPAQEPARQTLRRLSDEDEPLQPAAADADEASLSQARMREGSERAAFEPAPLEPADLQPADPSEPYADIEGGNPGDGFGDNAETGELPLPPETRRGEGRRPASALEPIDADAMGGAPLYQPLDASGGGIDAPVRRSNRAAPASLDARMGAGDDALRPLDAPVDIDEGYGQGRGVETGDGGRQGAYRPRNGSQTRTVGQSENETDGEGMSDFASAPVYEPFSEPGASRQDEVLPDAVPAYGAVSPDPVMATPPGMARPLILEGRVEDLPPEKLRDAARLDPPKTATIKPNQGGGKRSIFDFGRGALEAETPTGYSRMPPSEAMCRKQLQKLGVKFVDASSIKKSRSCGIDYPVKIHDIAPGIAMRPSATLNCEAALRVAQWMKDEVKPAARWKMLKRPTVLINASSYRCSRIAGSRSVSQHASGSALDVRGFKFSDGSIMDIERKGFFSFRERGFQKSVRESACRHFGTVLGPGYNEDHADHLHLDTKQRRRAVCK